jgi:hypothetical protein
MCHTHHNKKGRKSRHSTKDLAHENIVSDKGRKELSIEFIRFSPSYARASVWMDSVLAVRL